MPKRLRTTAAWRISIWTATAFAIGTAVAFSIVYLLVALSRTRLNPVWRNSVSCSRSDADKNAVHVVSLKLAKGSMQK
jgi:hypothetical protein